MFELSSVDSLSKISHDFKTPLNIILSSTAMLRLKTASHSSPQSDLQKYIHYIEQNCHRLLRMVNSLIDHPSDSSGTLPFLTSQCDLERFLNYTLEDLCLLSNNQGIELYFQSHLSMPCVMNFDQDHLERILANLISNAVKHTPAGGVILVSLHADDDFAYISVTDSGEGIPKQFLPELFKPYRTGNSAATEPGSNTGLGLPIVKELVELHQGHITVSSSVGKGSRFAFSLSRHLPITTEFQAEDPAGTAGLPE